MAQTFCNTSEYLLLLVVDVEISRDLVNGIPLVKRTLKVLENDARILLLKSFFKMGKFKANHPENLLPDFVLK